MRIQSITRQKPGVLIAMTWAGFGAFPDAYLSCLLSIIECAGYSPTVSKYVPPLIKNSDPDSILSVRDRELGRIAGGNYEFLWIAGGTDSRRLREFALYACSHGVIIVDDTARWTKIKSYLKQNFKIITPAQVLMRA